MNRTSPGLSVAKPAALGRWPAPGRRLRCLREQLLVAAALAPLLAAAYYAAYWLRFEGSPGPEEIRKFLATVSWVVWVKLCLFGWFGVYQGWRRLVTFYDLVALVQASAGSLLVTVLLDRFLLWPWGIPRSIFLLDWAVTIGVIGGLRCALRGFREYRWTLFFPSDRVPAFIVGANETGELLLRAIIRNGQRTYRVAGFIDTSGRHLGTRVAGVPVVGSLEQTCLLAQRYGVRELLVVGEELSGQRIRRLMEEARGSQIEVRVLPSLEQMISGRVAIQPRPVAIEDLLRREPVALDLESIRRWIDHQVLLVTGSAGSIGSEICRQLLQFAPRRLVLVDRSETGQFFLERQLRRLRPDAQIDVCLADVLDRPRMRQILGRYRPQVIFHAAAYKHVPLLEAHPQEAVKNIILATRQLADLAAKARTDSFVLISTDKAVNPTSVMGACKRVAELYVQALSGQSPCRFVTVRFGNVLDSAGSVVQIFRQQIAAGGPITITDPEMRRYFMTIPEAARLVIQAGAIGTAGRILLLDMGEPVRIMDLAADMIRLSGLRVGEDIAIQVIGPRPGEKKVEQLRAAGEHHLPTSHPKIIAVDSKPADLPGILDAVEQLELLAQDDPERLVEQLRQVVPEYAGPIGRGGEGWRAAA
ncbi:MAG: polysaccharide biosynthesis protein [Thermoguttaceae bacterium]